MANYVSNLEGNFMGIPESQNQASRSEGAKKMWQRRKAKEIEMAQSQPGIKSWVYHTEWFALMSTVIICFVFVFHEAKHTNDRLDNHMEAINRRCDDLHKEFYDLLKEMRK